MFSVAENIKQQIEATAENNQKQLTVHSECHELSQTLLNLSFQNFVLQNDADFP